MNIVLVLIIILLFIVVIFTVVDKCSTLMSLCEKEKNKNNKEDNEEFYNEIFIKYSSIKNKLNTIDDYIDLHYFINNINESIYISEIQTNEKNRIIELITNDIQKTKLKYNFNKLKNIFVIIKTDDYCV